jgi:hypothetical protein
MASCSAVATDDVDRDRVRNTTFPLWMYVRTSA